MLEKTIKYADYQNLVHLLCVLDYYIGCLWTSTLYNYICCVILCSNIRRAKQEGPKRLGHGRVRDWLCVKLDTLHRQRRRRCRDDRAWSTGCRRTDQLSTRWSCSVLRQLLLQRESHEGLGEQGTGFMWNCQSNRRGLPPQLQQFAKTKQKAALQRQSPLFLRSDNMLAVG